jgi:hypothetical protein
MKSASWVIRNTAKKHIRTALIVGYHPQLTSDPRPARLKSNMPEHIRDYFESYGLNHAVKGFGTLTGARIDIHDAVVAAMASRHLDEYRSLIWARAANVPWKKIVPGMGCGMRMAKYRYSQGLTVFAVTYGLVAVNAMHEERAAA